jgi:competence protein ComEA
LLTAWPRSAQLTTAFLLGVCLTLLTVQALGFLRWGSRPSELEAAPVIVYRIDLNKASRAELLQLQGVGPALADRIIAHREEHGGFTTVEELGKVHGIGPATLAKLRPWVCVSMEDRDPPAPLAQAPIRKPTRAPTEPSDMHRTSGKKETTLSSTLDVNRATQEELQRLPGIGPKMSQRILDERARAPFKSVDDLRRVSGIGPKTLDKLRPYVRVGDPPPTVAAAE